MSVFERTSIANVVSGAILIIAAVYSVVTNNSELLRTLALISAGYLFGTMRGGNNGRRQPVSAQ